MSESTLFGVKECREFARNHDDRRVQILGERLEDARNRCARWAAASMQEKLEHNMLEFLLSQFQMHSPHMDGQHSYRFRNGGWPMTHLRGPNIKDAIRNAMDEVEREKQKIKPGDPRHESQ